MRCPQFGAGGFVLGLNSSKRHSRAGTYRNQAESIKLAFGRISRNTRHFRGSERRDFWGVELEGKAKYHRKLLCEGFGIKMEVAR